MAKRLFYFITEHYQLAEYLDDGTINLFWTDHYAKKVCVTKDGTAWILAADMVNPHGGYNPQYWDNENQLFRNGHNVNLEPGGESIGASLEPDWVWYLTENHVMNAVSKLDLHPKCYSFVEFIDFSFDLTKNGLLWGIENKLDRSGDGSKLLYINYPDNDLKYIERDIDPLQISAHNGNCYIVNSDGKIVAVDANGGFGNWSNGIETALKVSAGSSGLFAISKDVIHSGSNYGNAIKYWDGSQFSNLLDKNGNPVIGLDIAALP